MVALLAFHLALINNPQHVVVVLTLASVLYHGKWKDSVKFAREHAPDSCIYTPEVLDASNFLSDDEIAERVTQFVVQVQNSVDLLVDTDCLLKALASFPKFTCSGLVFVSKKMGQRVEQVFNILTKDVTMKTNRNSLEIDYCLLGEGNVREIRFVLGKIIINTLVCRDVQEIEVTKGKKVDSQAIDLPQNMVFENIRQKSLCIRKSDSISKDGKKRSISLPNNELQPDNASKTEYLEDNSDDSVEIMTKNQMTVVCKQPKEMAEIKQETMEEKNCQVVAKKRQKVSSKENVCSSKDCLTNDTEKVQTRDLAQGASRKILGKWQHKLTANKQKVVENEEEYQKSSEKHIKLFEKVRDKTTKKQHMPLEKQHGTVSGNESSDSPAHGMATEENEKDKLGKGKKQGSGPKLSALFK